MTIDEMKEFALLCFLMSKRDDKESIVEIFNAFDELEWYRNQDLILREDATKIFAEHIELTTDMDEGQAMFVAEHQYRIIPKAEYRGDDDGNNT